MISNRNYGCIIMILRVRDNDFIISYNPVYSSVKLTSPLTFSLFENIFIVLVCVGCVQPFAEVQKIHNWVVCMVDKEMTWKYRLGKLYIICMLYVLEYLLLTGNIKEKGIITLICDKVPFMFLLCLKKIQLCLTSALMN